VGVGPLIAWRRGVPRKPQSATSSGRSRSGSFAGGRRVSRLVCPLAAGGADVSRRPSSSAATIAVDFHARPPARAAPRGRSRSLPAMGGAFSCGNNRRYGGFRGAPGYPDHRARRDGIARLGRCMTETTLHRGRVGRARRVPFSGSMGSPRFEESNHFKVIGAFTVSNGRVLGVLRPAQEVLSSRTGAPSRTSTIVWAWREDVYLVLGDFARDGSQATIKLQVNRLVSWIWNRRIGTHPGGAAGHPAGGGTETGVKAASGAGLIPLAAVPVLALLAYGFRVKPAGNIPSPPRRPAGRRPSRSPRSRAPRLGLENASRQGSSS